MYMSFLNIPLSLLFPKTCISCRTEGAHLCEDCLSTVSLNTKVFPSSSPSLTGLLSATSLKEPLVQKALQYYKHPPFLRDLSSQFAFLIISHFIHSHNEDLLENSVLYPIPTKRLRWRGFDPAQKIAEELSLSLHIPIKNTPDSKDKRVLLVDDIYKTGATMEKTASVLREAGVKEIWGVVVARG